MKTIIAALLMFTGTAVVAESPADSCRAMLPERLLDAVANEFREFRAPLAADNLAEDVAWNKKQGGNGCLGVAKGDFDGDGSADYLLGLTATASKGSLVVVASAKNGKWAFHRLDESKDGRARLYVEVGKPGTYERTEALDGPLENGELNPLVCRNSAAIFGTTESSGVAFCLTEKGWRHVWISD